LFLIRKELQDVANHVQLAPREFLALRPIDNDVPDVDRRWGSPSTAFWRGRQLRMLRIRHNSHHFTSTTVVCHFRRIPGRRRS
jgi:hypothetical protein